MKSCHNEGHPLMNVYGKIRKICPVCGWPYYEDFKTSVELDKSSRILGYDLGRRRSEMNFILNLFFILFVILTVFVVCCKIVDKIQGFDERGVYVDEPSKKFMKPDLK